MPVLVVMEILPVLMHTALIRNFYSNIITTRQDRHRRFAITATMEQLPVQTFRPFSAVQLRTVLKIVRHVITSILQSPAHIHPTGSGIRRLLMKTRIMYQVFLPGHMALNLNHGLLNGEL
jgi:hypothetical protein